MIDKKRTLTVLAAILLIGGCATQPISTSEAQFVPRERILDSTFLKRSTDSGEIVVKRDTGLGGSACNTRIFIDGKPTAEIATGEKISIHLPVGDHIVSAWPNNPCGGGMVEVRAGVVKGKTLVFRVGYGSNGDFGLYPTAF